MLEEKFNDVYEQIVKENTEYMELLRKNAKKENIQNIIIIIIIIVINILLNYGIFILLDKFYTEITSLLVTLSIAVFAVIKHRGGKSKIEQYAREYKEKVISKIVKSFNENLDFTPSERINTRCI